LHEIGLAAHKVHGVREALAAAGAAVLYLPLYSPDLSGELG
jgi:transposase